MMDLGILPLLILVAVVAAIAIEVSLKLLKLAGSVQRKLIAIALVAALGLTTGGIVYTAMELATEYRYVSSMGVLVTGLPFDIYWDITGLRTMEHVDWGTLEPGQTANVTCYIRNRAATPIYCDLFPEEGSFEFKANQTSPWEPGDGAWQYFNLTWTFGDAALGVSRIRTVKMHLHVLSNITGIEVYRFNMTLMAQDGPFG